MYKLSSRSKKRYAGVKAVITRIINKGITHSPYDFGAPEYAGMRTSTDQNVLFRAGKSQCDGYDKLSKHQSGEAFDIYAYVNGAASWDPKHLLPIARHLQAVALTEGVVLKWGGEFLTREQRKQPKHVQNLLKATGQGWDAAHFEIEYKFEKV